jgi:uncharacterized protein YbjT (DUF2867 family)
VRVLSRHRRRPQVVVGDLRTGTGLPAALEAVNAVLHCASDPRAARQVDRDGTARLVAATRDAGRPHPVYVSIVGVDDIPWSFYWAKRQAEDIVAGSGCRSRCSTPPSSTRSWPNCSNGSPSCRRCVPRGFRVQPVDPAEVADRLVAQVASGPAGRAPDFGGPAVLDTATLAHTWLEATGRRRIVMPVPVPGRSAAAFRAGANLCPDNTAGLGTWQNYLATEGRAGPVPQS